MAESLTLRRSVDVLMKSSFSYLLPLLLTLPLACSDAANSRSYGLRCDTAEQCASGLCERNYCSEACEATSDCPATDALYFSCDNKLCVPKQPKPQEPLPYGFPCVQQSDCASALCIDGYCSKTCVAHKTCAAASGRRFYCGQATADTVACYPEQHQTADFATGYDCSVDGKCAVGWKCMGAAGGADRFCSPLCTNDKQCPPSFRCAEIQVGDAAPEKRCTRRAFGHPCVINDDCGGAEDLCITDKVGAKYCSKACSKTSASTCPPFSECQDAGNGAFQCKYKKGYAYTSAGTLCDPCLFHYDEVKGATISPVTEPGRCVEGGACVRLSPYTNETICLTPCDPNRKEGETGCPEGFGCTVEGEMCVPIMANPDYGQPGQPEVIIGSCYPVPL